MKNSEINGNPLSRGDIECEIRSAEMPKIIVYNSIDSTNSEAKRLATSEYFSPTLIVANSQSEGRGRMGRSFYSPAEDGLYMTLLYKSAEPMSDSVSVTTAAAAAVALSLEELSDKRAEIKWVNDIYMNGGKVSGILAESVVSDGECHIIVGIGINVTTETFPDELRAIASSVGALSASRSTLAARIYDRLWSYICKREPYIEDYRARFMLLNKCVNAIYKDKTVSGKILGVDDGGGLILLPDGEDTPITVISGEVSVRVK